MRKSKKGLKEKEFLKAGSFGHPVANREADFLLSEICTQENEISFVSFKRKSSILIIPILSTGDPGEESNRT